MKENLSLLTNKQLFSRLSTELSINEIDELEKRLKEANFFEPEIKQHPGKIIFSQAIIDDLLNNPIVWNQIFVSFFPIWIDSSYSPGTFEYFGYSKFFDQIKELIPLVAFPRYDVIFEDMHGISRLKEFKRK